jgi:hypothetical protein
MKENFVEVFSVSPPWVPPRNPPVAKLGNGRKQRNSFGRAPSKVIADLKPCTLKYFELSVLMRISSVLVSVI